MKLQLRNFQTSMTLHYTLHFEKADGHEVSVGIFAENFNTISDS